MEFIISNFWGAVAALFTLTLIFHVILIWLYPRTKTQWKRIDYIWISLAALGLVGETDSIKKRILEARIDGIAWQIPSAYEYMCSRLSADGSPTVCRGFVRSEYSPPNFDEIVADYDRSCKWSKEVFAIIQKIDTQEYSIIDTTKLPILITTDNNWFKNIISEDIRRYNSLIYERDDARTELNYIKDGFFEFLRPLLLILGLSIRLTKVTGEVKLEKKKATD